MGCLASDSRTYGIYPIIEGTRFIQDALIQHKQGRTADDIVTAAMTSAKGKPYIMGYRRPIAKGDERLETMEKISAKLGLFEGEHLLLAYEIEKVLLREYDEGMNIIGYASAFLSDQGFNSQEVYHMFSMLVASGVTACYLDTYHQPPDTFLPLRCDDIDYQGAPARTVPKPTID
jgi:citrate synthase